MTNGESKKLSKETFEQVYKILTQSAPTVLIKSEAEKAQCANRYELIKSKL